MTDDQINGSQPQDTARSAWQGHHDPRQVRPPSLLDVLVNAAPYDTHNALLRPGSAFWNTCIVDTPDSGQRVMFTIRTTSATVTVFLTRDEAESMVLDIMRSAGEVRDAATTDTIAP